MNLFAKSKRNFCSSGRSLYWRSINRSSRNGGISWSIDRSRSSRENISRSSSTGSETMGADIEVRSIAGKEASESIDAMIPPESGPLMASAVAWGDDPANVNKKNIVKAGMNILRLAVNKRRMLISRDYSPSGSDGVTFPHFGSP